MCYNRAMFIVTCMGSGSTIVKLISKQSKHFRKRVAKYNTKIHSIISVLLCLLMGPGQASREKLHICTLINQLNKYTFL